MPVKMKIKKKCYKMVEWLLPVVITESGRGNENDTWRKQQKNKSRMND